MQTPKRPELLLPVGTKEMALAAIHNGADAIFMGVPGFNARGRSYDFQIEEVQEIIKTCHLYGVKVNLAFNILIFQNELTKAQEVLEKILPLKPDALIIQDLGLVRLVRKLAPEQRIHASTQMSVTNAEAIHWLSDLGMQRFVLARENSLSEIKKICAATDKEIEVFVHGALCVSYSGQCFTSESIGGRSANRGQCAQSCRFSYEMHVDGEKRDLNGKSFLVSPQDLCGINEVPELIEAGVACFKVEGRLKTPEYVATAARSFDEAIEKAQVGQSFATLPLKKQMASTYSRGFFSGWFHGVNHQKLVEGTYSAHRGFEFAKIVKVGKSSFTVELNDDISPQDLKSDFIHAGDGLLWVYQNSAGESQERGGFVFAAKAVSPRRLELEFSRDIMMQENFLGARVYYNHDKDLKKDVSLSIEDRQRRKRIPVNVKVQGKIGSPLTVSYSDGIREVSATSTATCEEAKSRGLTKEILQDELYALSGSVFVGDSFECDIPDNLFLPHKQVKELRQNLTAQLETLRRESGRNVLTTSPEMTSNPTSIWLESTKKRTSASLELKLNVLLREKGQVEDLIAAISSGKLSNKQLNYVILDFEFGRDYETSVLQLKNAGIPVAIATTRILKPTEHANIKHLLRLNPDAILARNLGAVEFIQKSDYAGKILGDFSLNVTNHLTAQYLLKRGIETQCLGYDLNQAQVSDLLGSSNAHKLEVTVFQYMPSFHMEHCVFAAFLSKGSSFKDCGKPCEKHEVKLKDQFGNWHQIKPDQECRNTMFNSTSQSAARFIQEWKELGLGFVRYEALKERGSELITKISAHLDFISGQKDLDSLMKELGNVESYGLSESHFQRDREYQSRKKNH